MYRRVNENSSEPKGKWLITFNDLITLLLTFFVLIISMSMIAQSKVTGIADSARKVAGVESAAIGGRRDVIETGIPSIKDEDIQRVQQQTQKGESVDPLAYRKEILAGLLKNMEGVKIVPAENGFSLSLNENLLFASGSAEITASGQNVLKKLGAILLRADAFARVEGHTDSTPIHSVKYPSNWELSMSRATNIVRWFADKGGVAPERFSSAGYADTRPQAPDDNQENRDANRRVEIVLTFVTY
jgi:chemotaxis protein MotB